MLSLNKGLIRAGVQPTLEGICDIGLLFPAVTFQAVRYDASVLKSNFFLSSKYKIYSLALIGDQKGGQEGT